ncbi:MAG: hypothetical protein DRI90_02250 [Deltaproteobacteria bacterium]|nr:MAG: hypothetical protein DRI90_02250 [Deltaproteobacteria bacterium]
MARGALADLFERDDLAGLYEVAQRSPAKVIRFLVGRLYGSAEGRSPAVRALGQVVGDQSLVTEDRAVDQLRRFMWALNDESGAVPYGVPEAIGEVLVQRPELQDAFLPPLCSMLTVAEMAQTGRIERGVVWALGRVGPVVATCCPEAVAVIEQAATDHADEQTRLTAQAALQVINAR